MAQLIEHTPYAWSRWRGRVVLYKRVSNRLIAGVVLYFCFPPTVLSLRTAVDVFERGRDEGQVGYVLFVALVALGASMMLYGLVRLCRHGGYILVPTRIWLAGRRVQLRCETLRIPQPTSMGGTLPGPPTRWLVVKRAGKKPRRLVQVYHDLDLVKVNVALAGGGRHATQ